MESQLNSTMYFVTWCESFMRRWSISLSASPVRWNGQKFVLSSRRNKSQSSSQSSSIDSLSMASSNHSRAVPLRNKTAKLTLSESCGKFFGRSWKFNSHWTKKLWSLRALDPSKGSGSLTCARAGPLSLADSAKVLIASARLGGKSEFAWLRVGVVWSGSKGSLGIVEWGGLTSRSLDVGQVAPGFRRVL